MSGQHEKHCGPVDFVLSILKLLLLLLLLNLCFSDSMIHPSSPTEALTICFAYNYSTKIHRQTSYFCRPKSQANHAMCYGALI